MSKFVDVSGERFGRLVATKPVLDEKGKRTWECHCDCGGVIFCKAGELRSGNFRSCGCLKHTDCSIEKLRNLVHEKFGKLLVIRSSGEKARGWDLWLCRCDCGNEKIIDGRSLVYGLTLSCGCLRGRDAKHGDCKNNESAPIYRLWGRIKERCYSPNKDGYHRYGGRGIKVCDEWLNDYEAFKKWAIESGFKKGLQIDRKDNGGNYEPGNCRFVTGAVNTQN